MLLRSSTRREMVNCYIHKRAQINTGHCWSLYNLTASSLCAASTTSWWWWSEPSSMRGEYRGNHPTSELSWWTHLSRLDSHLESLPYPKMNSLLLVKLTQNAWYKLVRLGKVHSFSDKSKTQNVIRSVPDFSWSVQCTQAALCATYTCMYEHCIQSLYLQSV